MVDAGRGEALPEPDLKRPDDDPQLAAAIKAYLQLAAGDHRLALALSVADLVQTARLVSRGYARWGQPRRRSW